MIIAFVSLMKVFPWGGSEELWYRTAKLALANGHTVSTLTQRWEIHPEKINELNSLGANTEFYFKPQYSIGERAAIKFKFKNNVLEVIPDINADVFVVSNGSTWDFVQHYPLAEYIIRQGKPYIIINQHSYESGNILAGPSRENAIQFMHNARRIFFVATRNIDAAERQVAYHIPNTQIISNPININNLAIKAFPNSTQLSMACVARLDCDYKGQDILLQALSAEHWVARDFHLTFYGAGPHLSHIQLLITLYQLQDKVSIAGHVRDVDSIWDANQVLVLPSLSEGMPLALVEAMLSGRTALATDVGDNNRYIIDGQTGFLVATASVKSLAGGLERLWNNRASLQTMGEHAFKHACAITDLHPEQILLNFIELIEPDNNIK